MELKPPYRIMERRGAPESGEVRMLNGKKIYANIPAWGALVLWQMVPFLPSALHRAHSLLFIQVQVSQAQPHCEGRHMGFTAELSPGSSIDGREIKPRRASLWVAPTGDNCCWILAWG